LRDKIVDYLTPLSIVPWLTATNWASLSTTHKNVGRLWDYIFKDETWIKKVLEVNNDFGGSPVPTLVSCNLKKIFWGKPKGVHVALLVNDWTGDV